MRVVEKETGLVLDQLAREIEDRSGVVQVNHIIVVPPVRARGLAWRPGSTWPTIRTKTHVGHILAKLDLRDRAQAVVVAYEFDLVTPGG